MKFMGFSSIKNIGIYDGMVRSSVYVAGEVLATLERWYKRVRRIAGEKVDGIHEIKAGI